MAEKVLVVEDEITLLETLAYNLQRQGYSVHTAADGRTGLDKARLEKPDLIILDVMLPGIDGLEICRVLRREMNVPIIMLTAMADEVDKIVGLEVGADDYLTKPFSLRELLARVKAQLRRTRLLREELGGESAQPIPVADRAWEYGNLTLDIARREVRLDGQVLHLKPKEFDLLVFLARNRGIALSRDLILERVWGWENIGISTRTVDVHVRWLREKIEPDPEQARRIVTVRGVGYRFEG